MPRLHLACSSLTTPLILFHSGNMNATPSTCRALLRALFSISRHISLRFSRCEPGRACAFRRCARARFRRFKCRDAFRRWLPIALLHVARIPLASATSRRRGAQHQRTPSRASAYFAAEAMLRAFLMPLAFCRLRHAAGIINTRRCTPLIISQADFGRLRASYFRGVRDTRASHFYRRRQSRCRADCRRAPALKMVTSFFARFHRRASPHIMP